MYLLVFGPIVVCGLLSFSAESLLEGGVPNDLFSDGVAGELPSVEVGPSGSLLVVRLSVEIFLESRQENLSDDRLENVW